MKFGENLKLLRMNKNLSQEELAEEMGVSRQSVSKWETSLAYPEMKHILKLCNIFGCQVTDLVRDSMVDLDSLDEEIRQSVVKFKKAEQRNMKGLSKAIVVISKISRIVCTIAIPLVVISMILIFMIMNHVSVVDHKLMVSNDTEWRVIEDNQELRVYYGENLIMQEHSEKTIEDVKYFLEHHSKLAIISYVELGFATIIICLVLSILVFQHLERLFSNIHKGVTPFTKENVCHIKKIAYLMIAMIVLPNLGGFLFEILLQTDLGVDYELFDLLEILFLFCMAYIFQYGYEIQLDSNGIMYGDENE